MGDVLHAMPAVAALRRKQPNWRIGWAIEPRWVPLLQAGDGAMPLVDRVHEVPTREWNRCPFTPATLGSILRVRSELHDAHYDVCVDMQGLLRSAVIGRFARAAIYAGPARPRENAARWLYGLRVQTVATHVVDRGCELLSGAIGADLRDGHDPRAAEVPLPVDPAAERWREQLMPHGEAYAVLAPTAGWGAKQWPVARYGAVAAALRERGIVPLVNAAKDGDATAEAVRAASGGVARPVACSMAELMALMRRASIVIAGDTGPLHLAAALRRPVVGLYGPTDPARTGPYQTRAEVIRHTASSIDHRRHPEPEFGLLQITVDEVMAAVERVVRASAG